MDNEIGNFDGVVSFCLVAIAQEFFQKHLKTLLHRVIKQAEPVHENIQNSDFIMV